MDSALMVFLAGAVFIIIPFLAYERSGISSKEIPILVVLASLAALGRIPFAAVPGVQPTIFIVIVSGFVFGPTFGFIVGALAILVSNIFLGQGPWVIYQMCTLAACGVFFGLLGRIRPVPGIKLLAPAAFLWGYLFGWLMNLWYWLAFIRPLNTETWVAVNAASFLFDTLRGLGNAAFMFIFGDVFIKILRYFKNKLEITYA